MIDIQFVRENKELVREKSAQKLVDIDVDQLIGFDDERKVLLTQVEALRSERNSIAAQMKSERSDELIEKGRQIKEKLTDLEHQLNAVEASFLELLSTVPNMPTEDTPVGTTEADNQVVEYRGEKPQFDFEPKSHDELLIARDLLDKERAAKVSGARFAYLKGDIVLLQFALLHFTYQQLANRDVIREIIASNNLGELSDNPFTAVLPPMMMRTDAYKATGRLKAEEVTYRLADDDLWLIGSAEHSLCSMYQNETLDHARLPIRYLGYSTSFRREAGTYGKDTSGIIRMHHFDKIEMEVFSDSATSRQEHELLIGIQKYLLDKLGLHYRVVLKCTADIGDPNARGVDIDTWFPGQNEYRETHSADYMTDFQARGLKTRYKSADSAINFIHTNDATALAMGRMLAAITEQYQTKEGEIVIPEVLRTFMGGKESI